MSTQQDRFGGSRRSWVPQPTAGELRSYGVAVLLVAAALLTRWILSGWFAGNVPYLQFFPAILVAAWYGGLGPGILATVLSALAAMYFSCLRRDLRWATPPMR